MSLAKKLEEMKSIERKNKDEKDVYEKDVTLMKAENDILKGEIDLLKRKLENETQLMIDHQNEKQNMDKRHRVAIQMLQVSLSKGNKQVRDQNFERVFDTGIRQMHLMCASL